MGQGKRLVAGPLKAKRECPLCYLLAGPELERLPCPPCRDQGTGLVSNDAGAGRIRAHRGHFISLGKLSSGGVFGILNDARQAPDGAAGTGTQPGLRGPCAQYRGIPTASRQSASRPCNGGVFGRSGVIVSQHDTESTRGRSSAPCSPRSATTARRCELTVSRVSGVPGACSSGPIVPGQGDQGRALQRPDGCRLRGAATREDCRRGSFLSRSRRCSPRVRESALFCSPRLLASRIFRNGMQRRPDCSNCCRNAWALCSPALQAATRCRRTTRIT